MVIFKFVRAITFWTFYFINIADKSSILLFLTFFVLRNTWAHISTTDSNNVAFNIKIAIN